MAIEVQRIPSSESRLGQAARLGLIATTLLAGTSPAAAQLNLTTTTACTPQGVQTRLIEWDLTRQDIGFNEDVVPGAMTVDDQSSARRSRVWFVTRAGETRVYRLLPGRSIKNDAAQATSWPLGALLTGGVRLRHSGDGRFAFVNATNDDALLNGALIAVDTVNNTRVTWVDRAQQTHMSDVSVDTRGGGQSVFTAALEYQCNRAIDTQCATGTDGGEGVVQRLRPRQPQFGQTVAVVPADVTRWLVGNGAGTCTDTGVSAPCIPGIAVDRRRGHPIFFSAPGFPSSGGAIGELDPRPVKCDPYDMLNSCAKVRYWRLPNPNPTGVAISGARQLLVDDYGKLWGITSSGHLFSLEVSSSSNRAIFTIHNPDGPGLEDLFAVAPDGGTIGFTDSNNNEVSVLFPQKFEIKVDAVPDVAVRVERRLDGQREAAQPAGYAIATRVADAQGLKYTKANDGTYVETNVATGVVQNAGGSDVASEGPTGMQPDGSRKTGSFFYGVTFSGGETNRIGHFEATVDPEKELEARKDDDDYDDDGNENGDDPDDDDDGYGDAADNDDDNDCVPDAMDNDHDNDGIENEHDTASHRENKRTDRGSMAPGTSKGYEMVWDANSVLILAIIEAADLTTPLSIEIVDPNGAVILSTPPALGKAVASAVPALPGVYTIRAKNGGTQTTTYKTTLIGKTIWF